MSEFDLESTVLELTTDEAWDIVCALQDRKGELLVADDEYGRSHDPELVRIDGLLARLLAEHVRSHDPELVRIDGLLARLLAEHVESE